MTAREERQLVKRIQSGDRHAFERLLDAYETRIYRLAMRFTGNETDAEDLTQEIFLAVYHGLTRFRGDSAPGTWIYRVAMNHCLEFRRKRRPEQVPLEEEIALTSTDWREDPLRSVEQRELAARVESALNRLSPAQRDVVVLHELQGLTYQEVATVLDVPVGTVKSRLANAFRRLRDLLGGYVHEETPHEVVGQTIS
ncbi:MAG: sigma-70 family RNA polymerase sigma factor [Chloroherpetonaceae bacterium]|nr:sigma-70 family RNA polymerase sigma factor [Chthonomonadaceae bacterium]MDW8208287.1 sigma-70 family RNA polymerase sigma factor [Chloroherpetonaceae bacterium]